VADPAAPVNGPFSADFKWATLPDVQATPIRFTDGQAKVFEALWSFKGAEVDGERIMQRAGQKSDKPIDLFKIKSKDKGKPEHEARLAAYGALVVTQQRAGLYSRCRARRLCWRDGLLLQAHPTTNGNGTRANHGRKRPCACATAKKLAPISREERAERRATGDVPARPQEPGRTRRMCGNPACHAGSTNENAQLRTVGR
jgi:hypothetical protein